MEECTDTQPMEHPTQTRWQRPRDDTHNGTTPSSRQRDDTHQTGGPGRKGPHLPMPQTYQAQTDNTPFPATDENREKLEDSLRKLYASSCFNTCEHQQLPLMTGPPLRLMIDPLAIPKPHHNPIPVPLHWQGEVKAGLNRDVRLGVLEKVPLGTPVTWCHRMVICTKKKGSLRRTIDSQELNKHATRETHHTQSPFHQAMHTKKTIFDAWNGYNSVALAEENRHYTTFITPWGRYRYCTAPQGTSPQETGTPAGTTAWCQR